MKNYYEILEVSENASPEVIEKAYKTLVKKYHPDLQPTQKKQEAENKIKTINEAYETLSNLQKKADYDKQLKNQKIKDEQLKYENFKKTIRNNSAQNNYSNSANPNIYSNYQNSNTNQNVQKRAIKKPSIQTQKNVVFDDDYDKAIFEAYNNAYQNAYNQAYINNLKNMGYEIRYEKTLKEKLQTFFAIIITIIVLAFVGFILWHIPFVKNYFIDLYNNNEFFKFLVDIIANIFKSFASLFNK